MTNLIIIYSVFIIIIPIILGIYAGCCGTKFIHNKERKEELLNSHLELIKEGNVIQGFPHNGWGFSYYPTEDRDWFYPKIYDFFYKWSVFYNFKWFDRC